MKNIQIATNADRKVVAYQAFLQKMIVKSAAPTSTPLVPDSRTHCLWTLRVDMQQSVHYLFSIEREKTMSHPAHIAVLTGRPISAVAFVRVNLSLTSISRIRHA